MLTLAVYHSGGWGSPPAPLHTNGNAVELLASRTALELGLRHSLDSAGLRASRQTQDTIKCCVSMAWFCCFCVPVCLKTTVVVVVQGEDGEPDDARCKFERQAIALCRWLLSALPNPPRQLSSISMSPFKWSKPFGISTHDRSCVSVFSERCGDALRVSIRVFVHEYPNVGRENK